MPIELLRQIIDYGGLYDRELLYWKDIVDINMICAAAPPGGGRKDLTSRFTRHFNMVCLPPTSEENLQSIFREILKGFLKAGNFKKEII